MPIELVVFDMAGTTVQDPGAVRSCFSGALRAAGLDVGTERIDSVMGLPKPEAVRLLVQSAGLRVDEQAIHRDFVARMQSYYASDPSIAEIRGATDVFATLRKAGIRVGLDTGFSREIVEVLLNRLGWSHGLAAVDATVASDEVERGRPFPDMILHLMRQLGVLDPRRVAKVGDTIVDLEEGKSAGCSLVIGVTTGTFSRSQLESGPHTHIVNSVRDIPAIILPRGRIVDPEKRATSEVFNAAS